MMGTSAYFHLFLCQNQDCMVKLQKLDYTGIAVMISGCTFPPFYYGFYCNEMIFWRNLWIGQVWICCAIALLATYCPRIKSLWINAIAWLIAGYSVTPGLLHLKYYSDPKYGVHF